MTVGAQLEAATGVLLEDQSAQVEELVVVVDAACLVEEVLEAVGLVEVVVEAVGLVEVVEVDQTDHDGS